MSALPAEIERVQDASPRRLPFQRKIGAGLDPDEFARRVEKKTLRHVGLFEERYRHIGGYSTGMKQRVKLAQHADRLAYKRGFSIYDEADSLRLVTLSVKDLDLDPKRMPPRGLLNRISGLKNELVDPDGNEYVTNTIRGSLNCSGNVPSAQVGDSEGEPNVVTGAMTGECAQLA